MSSDINTNCANDIVNDNVNDVAQDNTDNSDPNETVNTFSFYLPPETMRTSHYRPSANTNANENTHNDTDNFSDEDIMNSDQLDDVVLLCQSCDIVTSWHEGKTLCDNCHECALSRRSNRNFFVNEIEQNLPLVIGSIVGITILGLVLYYKYR